jgi:hypothetical protein
MKLSEALVLRADTQKRIEQLRARLLLNAIVQEGVQPSEDPQTLLAEMDRLLDSLVDLISRINRTNQVAQLADGATLTEALARRDVLKLRNSVLTALADAASQRATRYGLAEIRTLPTVDVGALRRQLDGLGQQHRELDTAIQAVNWSTELLE